MIASQKIGRSFSGALNYNLKKLYHPNPLKRAELLANNFSSFDLRLIQKELQLVRSLKPNLGKYVYHTSINFSNEDNLDNSTMLAIAEEYLERNGYTNNQYLIFRHYDADHPHLHLLVNRITFNGEVVSDSNNYKKSEAILRSLEVKYGLLSVAPSNKVPERAVTKDELEMIARTGKASEKMILQELMKSLLNKRFISIQELIRQGELVGLNFLFNQASTGRVTGITYFNNGFKIKGQSLGNQFKWAEIIKKVNYEQVRDSEAISKANERTTTKYGKQPTPDAASAAISQRRSGTDLVSKNTTLSSSEHRDPQATTSGTFANTEKPGIENRGNAEGTLETNQDADILDNRSLSNKFDSIGDLNIQVSDDIDDEAIHGRNRHRQKKSRTNTR